MLNDEVSNSALRFLWVFPLIRYLRSSAADMKKPDAVTLIPKDTFKEKIWGLPAADPLGVDGQPSECLTAIVFVPSGI